VELNGSSSREARRRASALLEELGRQVMELFQRVAHEYGTGVIVVTHDQRALEIFDTTYEMEDGAITKAGNSHTPGSSSRSCLRCSDSAAVSWK
jgi:ABC-type lipoprotein export system ATPase subunit